MITDKLYYQHVFGLAIQLTCAEDLSWDEANEYVNSLPKIQHATWTLPSRDNWKDMVRGCAIDGDLETVLNQRLSPINGFITKFEATGAEWLNRWYWSNNQDGTDRAYVVGADKIPPPYTPSSYLLLGNSEPKFYPYAARGCLWFGVPVIK